MRDDSQRFNGADLAFMVPTKDRPEKMKNLLESLAVQTVPCGRIIVVASGMDIGDLVRSFADRLPVEYHQCDSPGQIRQRNMAISLLDGNTPLAGSLDDDIVLELEAVSAMIDFWNRVPANTAGVAFNIVNNPPYRYSVFKAMIGMDKKQGRVLPSGYNVSTSPVKRDLKSDWLCGGATVWKQEILKRFHHRPIRSKWAIGEDVLFSYPVGKSFPLYVCAAARVRHEHVYDHAVKVKHRYYGRTVTLWRFYFIERHPELSLLFCTWMVIGQIIARSGSGLFLAKPDEVQYALGQVQGLVRGFLALARGKSVLPLLHDG
ncbi:MAG: glycosyltransferase [Desulfobacterales bacterium]|nr:glycosyltransferase [Desulfobacterales bacterium]